MFEIKKSEFPNEICFFFNPCYLDSKGGEAQS